MGLGEEDVLPATGRVIYSGKEVRNSLGPGGPVQLRCSLQSTLMPSCSTKST